MNKRFIFPELLETLSYSPAVALLGPRQVGKTTLALELGKHIAKPTLYLDLESEQDRESLQMPSCTYLAIKISWLY